VVTTCGGPHRQTFAAVFELPLLQGIIITSTMTRDDFDYAIENTQVILAPERQIATFGSTSFKIYLISFRLRD